MNEITKIHLGRQPFVIAIDAHKLLQDYLGDIKRQVGKNSDGVIDEVEMRMAELLADHGITGEKVILAEDVTYLKEQLGSPSDFKDDDDADDATATASDEQAGPTKRLFRDTEQGMLAGVSAGIADYFGIDPIIVRIIFVIATVSGGWGIAIYIVLWLIVPEAKTASERLQMRGKAVTVDSLKEIVDRADVTGAAHRASRSLVTVIEVAVIALLGVIGCIFAAVGVALFVGAAMLGVNTLLHHGHVIYGVLQFPMGKTEAVAVAGGFAVLVAVSAFLTATGVSIVRRKWSVPGWATAALCAVLLSGLIAGGAAAPDTVDHVRARYQSISHVQTRTVEPFTKIAVKQGSADVVVRSDFSGNDKNAAMKDVAYKVEVRYVGDVDVSGIKTSVKDGVLTIDTRQFTPPANWDCNGLCMGADDYFQIVVLSPQAVDDSEQVKPASPKFMSPDDL